MNIVSLNVLYMTYSMVYLNKVGNNVGVDI